MAKYKLVLKNGSPLIDDNSIVVQNIKDETFAYIEDSKENRQLLGISKDNKFIGDSVKFIMEPEEETTVEWHEENIRALLMEYMKHRDSKNPHVRFKRETWKQISNDIGISPSSVCSRKFRNLKSHYVTILRRIQTNRQQKNAIQWPYFELMQKIFGDSINLFPDELPPSDSEEEITTLVEKYLNDAEKSNDDEIVDNKRDLLQNTMSKRKKVKYDKEAISPKKLNGFEDMNKKQEEISSKLDTIINIMQESNEIQKKRNELFEEFIKMNSKK